MTVNRPRPINQASSKSSILDLTPGFIALVSAVPLAFLIHLVHGSFEGQPEKAILVLGGIFAAVLAVPVAASFLVRRKLADPAGLGLILIATIAVLLVAIYLYRMSFHVLFPADILIWSESDFVNDILKFRAGYPLYTAEVNNESYAYAPGTQLLTYFLAWLSGNATSIPFYRFIQVIFSLLSALVATNCCRRLVELASPSGRVRNWKLWNAVLLPTFFLIATNSLTNLYTHNLHNDALAQLVCAMGYWLLLRYVSTREISTLAMAAAIPAIGFFIKQSLAVWALLFCIQLALFDSPRSLKRFLGFALASSSGVAVVLAGCYLFWGDHFVYWTITVLAKHGVSPLRSFQHVLDIWPYFAIGLLGGFFLLRGRNFNLLLGPWLIWLLLILFEAYTSGAAWMLNHIGPGCLIAAIWFFAALTKHWPVSLNIASERFRPRVWLRAAICVFVLGLVFAGLRVVRIPVRPFPDDANRYVREIEREFEGQPVENTLLDMGTWVYMRDGVVMKDRAPAIGERGYSDSGDFSGIIRRLEQKHYSKILVRNLDSPGFWYDHSTWSKSSGIREAMLENYHEIGRIEAVKVEAPRGGAPYGLSEISILVPNEN